jgi:hypothetical protein
MNENNSYVDEFIMYNKNTLPVATLVMIQPNTIIPIQIIEAEVINEVNVNCNKICLIS